MLPGLLLTNRCLLEVASYTDFIFEPRLLGNCRKRQNGRKQRMTDRANFDDLEPSEDYLLTLLDGNPFTGIAYEGEALLVSETEFRDGQKSGRSRQWSDQGILIREEVYFRGSLHGEAKEWFPNGQIRQQGQYELGICLSRVEYDTEGSVIRAFALHSNSPQFRTLQKLRTGSLAIDAPPV
jgi:hypothetical protein